MKLIIASLLIIGTSFAARRNRMQQMAYNLAETEAVTTTTHNCTVAINRYKKGPASYKTIAEGNVKWTDTDFPIGNDMLYWSDHSTGSFSWRDWSWV